jgi:Ca2+-binding RTX toxin-like protein
MPTITVTDRVLVALGDRETFTNENGYFLSPPSSAPPDILIIRGRVEVTVTPGPVSGVVGITTDFGVPAPRGANVTIEPTGDLRVTSTRTENFTLQVTGFRASADIDFFNNGTVHVEAMGDAIGAFSFTPEGWAFRNTGSFTVISNGRQAIGVQSIGAFSNLSVFTVSGKSQVVGVDVTRFEGATVYNSGTILAIDTSGGEHTGEHASTGVLWRTGSFGGVPFTNDGRIEGDYALRIIGSLLPSGSPETFVNNGTMVGRVDMGDGPTQLINAGVIQGTVNLEAGADTYSGSGSAAGMVSGGDGADSLSGGAQFDNFQGNQGNDTVATGAGDDYCVGGKDNDSLSGGGDYDLVYGNIGADTCNGDDGNDVVRGGQDNDVVNGGAGDDFVSGDKGDDTVTGGAGADIFHTFGDAGIDRVTDFSLAEGDRVMLDPGTQFTVSQVGADTVINMTGGGQMTLVGVSMSTLAPGWIFGA